MNNNVPKVMSLAILGFVSAYTLLTFYGDDDVFDSIEGFIFYFLPSITLTILTLISWKYKWGGFLFIPVAYMLLLPYRLSIGIAISAALLLTGTLYLVSNYKVKNERRYLRKTKKLELDSVV